MFPNIVNLPVDKFQVALSRILQVSFFSTMKYVQVELTFFSLAMI